MRTLLAASSLLSACAHTRQQRTPHRVGELAHCRGYAAMAQAESSAVQQLGTRVQQQEEKAQQQEPSPLQQGFTIAPSSPQRPSTGFKKTFYKRKLPSPPAIEFSSLAGKL
jgi:hypothetical protein